MQSTRLPLLVEAHFQCASHCGIRAASASLNRSPTNFADLRMIGCFVVRRDSRRAAARTIRKAGSRVRSPHRLPSFRILGFPEILPGNPLAKFPIQFTKFFE
jgi:hypothetical protein